MPDDVNRRRPLLQSPLLVAALALGLSLPAAPEVRAAVNAAAPAAASPAVPVGLDLFAQPTAAMPLAPEVAARAVILQDMSSHQTLAARNADVLVEPARRA